MTDMRTDLGDAIADLVHKHETGVVTKWVALIETIGGDGNRGIWMLASPENQAWDTIGMLTHALHTEQAAVVARYGSEDEQ